MTGRELIKYLNSSDEATHIEAKRGSSISRSVMETICAYSNEPGIGEGYLILGVERDEQSLFPQYVIKGIAESDKLQSEVATNCASMFNLAVRPTITVETINDKTILIVTVKELDSGQKPLFFKKDGLPQGAYRRIGPTDQRCNDDDLRLFYSDHLTFDSSSVDYTSLADIDTNAIERYRTLRYKVNPAAEELSFTDIELLQALGCLAVDGTNRLTITGVLVFAKTAVLRRVFPMTRVDYIRVPGTTWIEDPDDRFTTIDMRGPLILMLFRIIDNVYSDLPKAFRLDGDQLQADSVGMPVKVMREAIVNALMHRNYRIHSPIQVIRYDNRLEIKNPGYSLKSEELLGAPGSETRNPAIAAIFHDTNLAETKGSGIRSMRRLLRQSKLAPPTFSSSREHNTFTSRFLLHHFLSKSDLIWLEHFGSFDLSDSQKQALIFVRETGAINNSTYRQMTDLNNNQTSVELRNLSEQGLLVPKGKGRGRYYRPGSILTTEGPRPTTEGSGLTTEGSGLTTEGSGFTTEGRPLTTEGEAVTTEARKAMISKLPIDVKTKLQALGRRASAEEVQVVLLAICTGEYWTLKDLATVFGKTENWLSRGYIKPLLDMGRLRYLHESMPNHPDQAYITKDEE